jgi:hypothetical protein
MSCEELPDVGFIFKLGWRGRLLGRLAKHRDEEQEGCDGAELSCVGVVEYIGFLVCRKSSNNSQCKNVIAFILRVLLSTSTLSSLAKGLKIFLMRGR